MRLTILAAALLLLPSTPTWAQRASVDGRVDTLEKQMRSVQRRVFAPGTVIPSADAPAAPPVNTGAVADLTARVDALERSLQALTGQVEETGNRLRTLEDGARRAEAAADARLDRLEGGASGLSASASPAPAPVEGGVEPDPSLAAAAPSPAIATPDPVSTDPAENAYLAGYRLWEAKRYDEAESVLKDMAAKNPRHRRASWARNLLGRTYLDTGKPATAAEAFLSNYQELPQGDRAADSLYFLGDALMKLNKPEQACKVYDELSDEYGASMRDFLKTSLPSARKAAKCTS